MKGIVADDLKTIKHVMHCELYKLEKTSCFEQGQISAGGHLLMKLCLAITMLFVYALPIPTKRKSRIFII